MRRDLPSALLFTAVLTWTCCALAAEPRTGTWSAHLQGDAVNLGLREPGHDMTFTLPRAQLQGLGTPEGEVRFQLVREAGTVNFEGRFIQGEGAGHYRFLPQAAWHERMARLGYTGFTAEEQFQATLFDLSATRLQALAELGYTKIPREQLIQVALFQVTPEHVLALKAAGFGSLSLGQLLQSRIHRVSPEFIREIREAGHPSVTFEQLVQLRIHAINAEYIRSLATGRKTGSRP